MKKIFFIFTQVFFIALSCREPHNREEYLGLITELHKIECEKLKKEGITFTINDTNIYMFRSIAFDKILTKDPDARLIAYYEDINQRLASMEYWMDDDQKKVYQEDFKQVYMKQCK